MMIWGGGAHVRRGSNALCFGMATDIFINLRNEYHCFFAIYNLESNIVPKNNHQIGGNSVPQTKERALGKSERSIIVVSFVIVF